MGLNGDLQHVHYSNLSDIRQLYYTEKYIGILWDEYRMLSYSTTSKHVPPTLEHQAILLFCTPLLC